MENVKVKEFKGWLITLDPDDGQFYAAKDGDTLEAGFLRTLEKFISQRERQLSEFKRYDAWFLPQNGLYFRKGTVTSVFSAKFGGAHARITQHDKMKTRHHVPTRSLIRDSNDVSEMIVEINGLAERAEAHRQKMNRLKDQRAALIKEARRNLLTRKK